MMSLRSTAMATILVAAFILTLVAARPLDVSGSRQLLQEGACPSQMTQCFTTPYQAQYYCCDSSANLACSGGPDFQCAKFLEGNALVPASLIPGQAPVPTDAPATTGAPATTDPPAPTSPPNASADIKPAPSTPAPTNPTPTKPAPTDPPASNPAPTNPAPTNPAPTNPAPTNPAPTNPAPTNPPPTNPPPTNPAPTNPPPTNPPPTNPPPTNPPATNPGPSDARSLPSIGSANAQGWQTGFATWYTDPNEADYFRTACFYNHPEQNPPGRFIVALPPHLFGGSPGSGNGAGCNTFWEVKCVGTLERIANGQYNGIAGDACATGRSIIVKGGDLCPECDLPRNDACSAEDAGYCPGPSGYTPGQPGVHLDLARPAWDRIGKNADSTGILAIWFRQVGPVPDSQLG